MLSVVCWKWAKPGYRSTFGPESVNTLRSMVLRHYPEPHRFICVTDDSAGIDPDVEIVAIWNDWAELEHPHNPTHPSCYRRLRAFAPEMREVFGKRFVSLDLDCVIVDDMRPIWSRTEDFVSWGRTHCSTPYNGSMWLMTAGSRPRVWKDFTGHFSTVNAKKAGFYGSDQAWISYILGPHEALWTQKDGVYSYRLDVAPNRGRLPEDARVVFFNGKVDPWSEPARSLPWVMEHYR